IIDFASRLTKTLNVFYDVIGNLDLQSGSEQLTPAETAFDSNSAISGDNRYTKEVKRLIKENHEAEDPNKPRGVYTNWGKRTCGNKASNILYIGYMASFMEQGIGAGTEYQCLPENPNLNVDSDATGIDSRNTRLAAVRYMNMSIFRGSGKQIQDKVAPCTVCETPLRPTVKMFPSVHICPGDWVPEYNGFLVSNAHGKLRSEFVCVNIDPDTYNFNNKVKGEPYVLPVKMGSQEGSTYTKDASIPCAVCSNISVTQAQSSAMLIRMMYVLPMILGRTYDVKKNTVGVDIFSMEDIETPRVTEESFYRSSLKTVETSSDVKEILEINGDLSLNIKAGTLAISGIGSYVKSALQTQNSLDILIKVRFRT
ncbi:stonustoxin subunit alpha, partial [Trichonephila clavata]